MKRTFQYKIKPVKPFGQTDQDEVVDFQQKLEEDIELIAKSAVDICKKYISEMSISHEDIDETIESVEDLTIFEGGVSILFDVYNQILRGWTLSPKSVKP